MLIHAKKCIHYFNYVQSYESVWVRVRKALQGWQLKIRGFLEQLYSRVQFSTARLRAARASQAQSGPHWPPPVLVLPNGLPVL